MTDTSERVGFFTDTSICIGCKACEVACNEWNQVPDRPLVFSGTSYDNTGKLGADAWRHVAFIEQPVATPATAAEPAVVAVPNGSVGHGTAANGAGNATLETGPMDLRWLMSSDVCKHCTSAACLEVCPTGSLFRTEFGTVVVQEDICNGCGYCVPACPFGVIDQRPADGRVWKCTLCYDRLKGGAEPACAQACPTKSIQFGPLAELRERAADRVATLRERGVAGAQLYGESPDDGVGGFGAFFLLLDQPEVYGLPPDPVDPTRNAPAMWRSAAGAALTLVGAAVAAAFAGRRR